MIEGHPLENKDWQYFGKAAFIIVALTLHRICMKLRTQIPKEYFSFRNQR